MLSGYLDKLKWICVLAALGGPVLAYFAISDTRHINNVNKKGVEAIAVIENMTKTTRRRGGTSYDVHLKWQDATGQTREAKGLSISSTLAKASISGDSLTVPGFPIKYLADDTDADPIIVPDIENQISNNDFTLLMGEIVGGVGLVSALAFFIFGGFGRKLGGEEEEA